MTQTRVGNNYNNQKRHQEQQQQQRQGYYHTNNHRYVCRATRRKIHVQSQQQQQQQQQPCKKQWFHPSNNNCNRIVPYNNKDRFHNIKLLTIQRLLQQLLCMVIVVVAASTTTATNTSSTASNVHNYQRRLRLDHEVSTSKNNKHHYYRRRRRLQQQQPQQQQSQEVHLIHNNNNNNNLVTSMPEGLINNGKMMIRDQLKNDIASSFSMKNNTTTTTATTSNNNKNHNIKQKDERTVVIHVGPHKTGTTTIQARLRRTMKELYYDGYMIPGNYNNKSSINMMSLTNCFLPKYNYTFTYTALDIKRLTNLQQQFDNNKRTIINNNNATVMYNNYDNLRQRQRRRNRQRQLQATQQQPQQLKQQQKQLQQQDEETKRLHDYSCNPNMLEDIRTIATTTTYDMILTAESFSHSVIIMERIQELLQPWTNKKVIVYYRRFYIWLYSLWNQTFKEIKNRPTFAQWIANVSTIKKHAMNNYITGVVPRWNKYFPNSVQIVNIHTIPNTSGIVETFFCNTIPHANQSCQRVREVIRVFGEGHANPSRSFVYKDLIDAADKMQLLSIHAKQNKTLLMEKVSSFQEHTLQLNQYEFPIKYRTCPNAELMDTLLQITLQTEEDYFPNDNMSDDIIKQFEHDQYTKLCHIDAASFLQNNQTWIKFFKSL